ncbi:adenylyltransferase/sulfurtransferase [Salinibacterium amurskyense]|uniref:Adenylyltransferase/sulfurtransferase n=1 Tax=Salinibacterium amurskyense TaxID=205941 RepID=A0A2M9D7H2_9MICO|nr:ThiF family adenylyltransferase [Salinibacterium amurskyense]PJJ81453.1 adenylyltransferase/sulfurtransferase [Salinibacterium amurskyense]RLQ83444.1 molybdopterin biosynthesis protein MoeB [Salinibacterium amurskyense]GHD80439.1 adenylyltransferase/sulfurtransferase MoeZ [Salinibacterium amurskyense]
MTSPAQHDRKPLVEPGAPLGPQSLIRYSRQLANPDFGELAQRRLANAHVLVVGAGGLGSATIPALAAMGVGTIGVIDTDAVELSNLHRQLAHGVADIGRSKLASMAETLGRIDPEIAVVLHDVWLDSSNALALFAGYDLVLDGSDNFATRYLVNDAAALTGIPVAWGAILRYGGQAGVAWAGHGPTYRDLFPVPPAPGTVPSCTEGGVLPTVCAMIGAIMCSETVKLITGIGDPLLGRVTTYDALTGRFRELEYAADDDTDAITELIDYEAFCGVQPGSATAGGAGADSDGAGGASSAGEANAAGNAAGASDEVDSRELAAMLRSGAPLQLVDIREPFEYAIAAIETAELIPLGGLGDRLADIRTDIPVVVYCHHGIRSERALRMLQSAGFTNIRHLVGGIDDYSQVIDPALARY